MCLKTFFYDIMFHKGNPISTQWGYYEILKLLPNDITILDVGVGDGIYFTNYKVINLIKGKNIKIHGIDIDPHSLLVCNKRILKNNLENHVKVELISLFNIKDKYDYILFMESFPVIENDLFINFLEHSKMLAKKEIFLYHNLIQNDEYSEIFSFTKRTVLYYITFNDFGKLTTIEMMKDILTNGCKINKETINMKILLECKYKEMCYLFYLIPYFNNKKIKQYLITIYN